MIEPGQVAVASRNRHLLAVGGAVGHQPSEHLRVDWSTSFEVEPIEARAHPPRWRLMTGVVVRLATVRPSPEKGHVLTDGVCELLGVVGGLRRHQLPQRLHGLKPSHPDDAYVYGKKPLATTSGGLTRRTCSQITKGLLVEKPGEAACERHPF